MKIRTGFVSNSSTTSFLCCVCGGIAAGRDMSLEDAEMYSCVNGHTFFDRYLIGTIDTNFSHEYLEKYIENYYKDTDLTKEYWINSKLKCLNHLKNQEYHDLIDYFDLNSRHTVLEINCPICTFTNFQNSDLLKYISTTTDLENLKLEIKSKFKTYNDFKNFIKDVKL